MATDPYRDFARVYDDWQHLYPRPFSLAIAPRVTAAIRTFGAPAKTLADLACGTGIFAHWWKRTHPTWTVYGADRSPAMIRAARRSRNGREAKRTALPTFLVQDLRDLSLPEPVGVVTCLFDSLNHLTRRADLSRSFRRIKEALLPGALFVFDLVDDRRFPEVFTGSSIIEGEDLYTGMETGFHQENGIGYGDARFVFFYRRGAGWRRLQFEIRERRWLRQEVRGLLRAEGLQPLRVSRIRPNESPNLAVPRTFWICRRRG